MTRDYIKFIRVSHSHVRATIAGKAAPTHKKEEHSFPQLRFFVEVADALRVMGYGTRPKTCARIAALQKVMDANCLRNIRHTRLAIVVSRNECRRASWNASCIPWRKSCRPEGNCWRRLPSTPPSRGQKRGPRGRAHRTWQGNENHRSRR